MPLGQFSQHGAAPRIVDLLVRLLQELEHLPHRVRPLLKRVSMCILRVPRVQHVRERVQLLQDHLIAPKRGQRPVERTLVRLGRRGKLMC